MKQDGGMNATRVEGVQAVVATGIRQTEQVARIIFERGQYISEKYNAMREEKETLAERAMQYIDNYQAVLLDAGSTVEILADRMFREKKYMTVLTNNMGVYVSFTQTRIKRNDEETHPSPSSESPPNLGNKLIISGGEYDDAYESLLGKGAQDSIEKFTPNVTIIGTSGLRCDEGIFCHGSEESAVKELLWKKPTDTLLIVTDWTKIGKRDAYAFGKISDLNFRGSRVVIVTNAPEGNLYGIPKAIRETERGKALLDKAVKEFEREKELLRGKGIIFDDGLDSKKNG